jgi:hypothetical protein
MRLVSHVIASLLLSTAMVGFVAGMLFCQDCGVNPLAYLFMGSVHACLALLSGGGLWLQPGELTNGWPFILPTAVVICLVLRARDRHRPRPAESENHQGSS